eukprot:gene12545-6366_t
MKVNHVKEKKLDVFQFIPKDFDIKNKKKEESFDFIRFVVISDTHMCHESLQVPSGDVLIHCGDFTNHGTIFEANSFNNFLGTLPHKHKITIPGNHENIPDLLFLSNTRLLLDETIELFGIKIHGSRFKPYNLFNWFMNDGQAKDDFNDIPNDVDILLTHQPGISKFRRNNSALEKKILMYKPKIHLFGHIHEAHGIYTDLNEDTIFICGSSLISKKKQTVNDPIIFDYSIPKMM